MASDPRDRPAFAPKALRPGVGVLLCVLATAQDRPARAPQTDQTVPVSRGARLAIDNFAGEVVVHAWDKDSLRVQARHTARTRINIRTGVNGVSITAESSHGSNGSVDYDINAPAWMPMKIEGHYNYVTIEGAQGDVSIVTVRGDIVLKGGGSVTARTIEGEIQVDGARGTINLSSVNQDIKVTGATGNIAADTTNGSIALARIESNKVEVATINGDVSYEGTLAGNGRYSFATHNGDIVMTVPESSNATFTVRTYNGEFMTSLPLKGPASSEIRRGRRVAYTLGNGSAEVDMESFGGAIRLRRPGATRTGRNQ
jgi:DUF4097 and DUF4098 domain-containing protein YvlB